MKKIIILAMLLIFPFGILAKNNWELKENRNTLTVAGACASEQVRVDLFAENNREPVYTSGALCEKGKFEFSDDLLRWKSLRDGEYWLVVAGDKQNTQKVFLKRPVEKADPIEVQTNPEPPVVEAPADPEAKLLNSFLALQQATLDMRTLVTETAYPSLIKESVDAALDGIDMLAGKITDLLWSADDPEENSVATENSDATLVEELPLDDPKTAEDEAVILMGDLPADNAAAAENKETALRENLPLEGLEIEAQ